MLRRLTPAREDAARAGDDRARRPDDRRARARVSAQICARALFAVPGVRAESIRCRWRRDRSPPARSTGSCRLAATTPSRVGERLQVAADRRLRQLKHGAKLRDRQFLLVEEPEHPTAGRVGKHRKRVEQREAPRPSIRKSGCKDIPNEPVLSTSGNSAFWAYNRPRRSYGQDNRMRSRGASVDGRWHRRDTRLPEPSKRCVSDESGTARNSSPARSIVVDGDRVVSVGTDARAIPAGAETIDLSQYTAIPGLIDLHTHMTYYWSGTPGTTAAQSAAARSRRDREALRSERAANARDRRHDGARSRRVPRHGPRRCATSSTPADGRAADVRRGPGHLGRPRRDAPDAAAMQQTTEARLATNADWVKVYASRGSFQSVDTTQTIGFDALKAIVDTAHAKGRKVAIHSYGPSGVERRGARGRGFRRARHRSRRRDARGDGEARHGLGADDRSQPVLRGRQGRLRVSCRRHPAAAGVHREEPRVDSPGGEGGRSRSAWVRTRCTRCSVRTRASSAGSSRPA